MATMLEEYTTEEQRSIMRSLWVKGINANYIHKEIFPVYSGKCLSLKAVHNREANVLLMTKRLKRKCGSQTTSVLRISTHG
jgi:hypothetical protein